MAGAFLSSRGLHYFGAMMLLAKSHTSWAETHEPELNTDAMLRGNHRHILENLNTAVLTLDADLNVTSINPAGEMLFDLSAKKLVGNRLDSLLPGDHDLLQQLQSTLKEEHPITIHGLPLDLPKRKSMIVDCTVTPVTDRGGTTELLLELVQVDRLLRLAREESILDQHAANKAVLKGLAHEIKNPLGGLRGAAQLLERELPKRELKEYTRIIIHEADRLRNLVDRMMGSHKPLKQESANIHKTLDHVRRLITVEFPASLDVLTHYDPSVPNYRGDPEQITQAILNIVRNSAQALQGKGVIQFRTRVERQFTIGHVRHRLVLRVDIEDDGPGIPEDMLEHIFYPMVTDKPEGTGLGLSIAQDIINKHNGVINCSSRPGKTVFSIYLPLEKDNDS
jgi:two-component system nitrogen regulation sensor histidine kinase GlnL